MILHTGWNDSAFNPKNWGGGGRDSKKSDTDKAVQQAVNTKDDGSTADKTYSASFTNDLSMGLSTFGQSTENQFNSLVNQGWSESAARDYQERTAASMKRALEQAERNSSDDNNSSTTTTTTTTTDNDDDDDDDDVNNAGTSSTNTSTLNTSSSGTSTNITAGGTGTAADGNAEADQIIANADGDAEAAVADAARKGRRGNILTTSQGLLSDEDDPNLRRRRSLMGGGLIN